MEEITYQFICKRSLSAKTSPSVVVICLDHSTGGGFGNASREQVGAEHKN